VCVLRLVTAAMEGFDQRRLCGLLELPVDDFSIPLVVALGYPAPTDAKYSGPAPHDSASDQLESSETTAKPKIRFPLNEMCFSECYGQSITVLTENSTY
jgi:hypothetical protein